VKTIVAGVFLVLIAFTMRASQAGPSNPHRKTSPPNYGAQAVNDSQNYPDLSAGDVGSGVVRLEILLDRAHFSPGEIDGQFGDNLQIAVTGYQSARALEKTGSANRETWQSLNADTASALVPYTISADDVMGPFEQISHDMMAQAKLQHLGYQSPQEELGERFHISSKLLAALNPGKDLTRAGEDILVPNVQREYVLPADKVVVSRNNHTVSAFAGDGMLLAQYPATMGSEHDPLPIGNWKITGVQQNPVFHYNPAFFWDAKPKDEKAEIAAGPNNPVGVVWIALSKEHYGIHGTPEPGKIGHTESHGCIRLTNWDAEELSRMVKPGTPAILEE
jgi:lipoprotein-anchoring transpeptidase ErfK/SrfK